MMKKNRLLVVLGLCVLAFAGCSPASGSFQEVLEQAAPADEAVAVTDLESSESATEHEVTCVIEDVPMPQQAEATLRFTNASGQDMKVMWRDTNQSPAQLVEYGLVPNGGTFDQESYAGHEWVLEDHDQNTLTYVVTAETRQCVILHHWGYEGETGPEHWAELRDNYETCASGLTQSPINLTDAGSADLENIVFEYGTTPIKILNNGHTIQVDQVENNQIVLSNNTYPLLQFHFHAPSEHTADGHQYPLEMHLVHKLATGEYAVVGVFIAEGPENTAFAPVWEYLPGEVTGATATGVKAR